MASGGTVTVDFAAETAKFSAELKKVRGDFAALRKESQTTNQMLSGFGSTIKGLLGVGALLGTVRAVVRETAAAAEAQALLNNALATAGADVKAVSADFQAYASQLQRTTTFGDEAVMQVETLLLSFRGLSGDTIKRATASVLDVATRMGIDAPAAAKLLGKALADPEKGMTALARAGVIFTDSQKEQIKTLADTGQAFEAHEIILKSLEDRYGGAAAAARNTFGGALAGVKNAFGDLLEGGQGFDGVTSSLNALADTLNSPEVKQGFATIIEALGRVLDLTARAAAGTAKFARNLGEGIAAVVNGPLPADVLDMDEVQDRLKPLLQMQKNIKAGWDEMDDAAQTTARVMLTDIESRIAALQKREEFLKRVPALPTPVATSSPALSFVTGGAAVEPEESDAAKAAREKVVKDAADFRTRITEQSWEVLEDLRKMSVDSAAQVADDARTISEGQIAQRIEAEENAANYLVDLEARTQQQLLQFREDGVNAAVSLMNSQNALLRTIGRAAFLYQKGVAIAEAANATRGAVMETYRRLGYPWGAPAAAAVAALGGAQIAAIARSSIGGMSNDLGAGGGGAGAAASAARNPMPDEANGSDTAGASSQRILQIIMNGNNYGLDKIKEVIVEAVKEYIDIDGVIISQGSRQAIELQSGS
jgi:hypothetical protein